MPPPQILDVTIRDGGYLLNHKVSPKIVSDILPYIAQAGLNFSEVSHGCGIGAKMVGIPGLVDDEELMEAAKKAAPDLKLSAFISPNDYSVPLIPALVDFLDLGRVGVNIDNINPAEKIITKLKKYKKMTSVQLVRAHARPPEVAAKAAKTAESMGADLVYLVDTFGSFTPFDVTQYIQAIKNEVKIPLGFHGHNHSGLALSNTLQAWKDGATWLDASLMGVGRGAGNANLEALITLLQKERALKAIKLAPLCEGTRKEVYPLFQGPPHSRLRDILFSSQKFDFSPEQSLELLSHILQIPLVEFAQKFRKTMGDDVQATDDHIKKLITEAGKDYDKILNSLKGSESNES